MRVKKNAIIIMLLLLLPIIGATPTIAQQPSYMVSYWKFDEDPGYDTAWDSVDLNNGTIYGATRTTGIVRLALSFDGVDDYVEVPDSSSLDISGSITLEAWVFPTKDANVIGGPPRIISKGGEGPRVGYELTWDWSNRFAFILWQPGRLLFSPVSYSKNQWYHVVGTFNGSVQRLYVNGSLVAEQSVSSGIPTNDYSLFIGRAESGYMWGEPKCYFRGIIDEVAIYNIAITPDEIQQHYENSLKGLGYYMEEASLAYGVQASGRCAVLRFTPPYYVTAGSGTLSIAGMAEAGGPIPLYYPGSDPSLYPKPWPSAYLSDIGEISGLGILTASWTDSGGRRHHLSLTLLPATSPFRQTSLVGIFYPDSDSMTLGLNYKGLHVSGSSREFISGQAVLWVVTAELGHPQFPLKGVTLINLYMLMDDGTTLAFIWINQRINLHDMNPAFPEIWLPAARVRSTVQLL